MEVKEKNCVITLTYTEKQPSNTQRSIQIQKKPLREVEIKGNFLCDKYDLQKKPTANVILHDEILITHSLTVRVKQQCSLLPFPLTIMLMVLWASLVTQMLKSVCSAGDPGLIPGSGRSPGEGNGNPLQYSCLENPMDRGAWQAKVHEVAKSWTRLRDFTFFLSNGPSQ